MPIGLVVQTLVAPPLVGVYFEKILLFYGNIRNMTRYPNLKQRPNTMQCLLLAPKSSKLPILEGIGIRVPTLIPLYANYTGAIQFALNPTYHERALNILRLSVILFEKSYQTSFNNFLASHPHISLQIYYKG